MTLSMRSIALAALIIGAAVSHQFWSSPPSDTLQTTQLVAKAPPRLAIEASGSADSEPEIVAAGPAADSATLAKYRYLLDDFAGNDQTSADLVQLLQQREDATRAGDAGTLSDVDARVRSMLDPDGQAMFQVLRDSDAQQAALGEFAGGISATSPLDDKQRREVLLTKLHHKQQFDVWRAQSGMDREQLSTQERDYAQSMLTRALHEYRDGYLLAAQAHLDETQFRQLSDYEQTEFAIELERIQQSINER